MFNSAKTPYTCAIALVALLLPFAAIALDMVRAGDDRITCQNQCVMTVYGDGSVEITDSGNGWMSTEMDYYKTTKAQ